MRMFARLFVMFLVLTVLTVPGAAAQTPPASESCLAEGTTRPECVDPDIRYRETAEGERDGIIILAIPMAGYDVVVHCIDGEINFATWIETNGDQILAFPNDTISCAFDSLAEEFPGSERVVRDDPKIGWTFVTEPDAEQDVVVECHGSYLIGLRAASDGRPEDRIDAGLPECAGNPVG